MLGHAQTKEETDTAKNYKQLQTKLTWSLLRPFKSLVSIAIDPASLVIIRLHLWLHRHAYPHRQKVFDQRFHFNHSRAQLIPILIMQRSDFIREKPKSDLSSMKDRFGSYNGSHSFDVYVSGKCGHHRDSSEIFIQVH